MSKSQTKSTQSAEPVLEIQAYAVRLMRSEKVSSGKDLVRAVGEQFPAVPESSIRVCLYALATRLLENDPQEIQRARSARARQRN